MTTHLSLTESRRAAEWALAIATALESGLVAAIHDEPDTADGIAARLEYDARGVRALLDALVEREMALRSTDGQYSLASAGRDRLLDPRSPRFEGAQLRLWRANFTEWATRLPAVVRGEAPAGPSEDTIRDLADFMAAMDAKAPEMVERVVDLALTDDEAEGAMLDLGGGPGTFARAFAARGMRAVLFDQPEVIEHVREAYGLDAIEGVELRAGDFTRDFPSGPFRLILLANITHLLGPEGNADLLRAAASELEPGGKLAILDFVRDRAPFAPLFAITMLLRTEEGRTYGSAEYEQWLAEAGLEPPRFEALDEDRHLIIAQRTA